MADEVHALVGPYALDALDEGEERSFEQHLALCARCREELAGLREAAASLAYAAPPTAPPPELKQRILAQARAERPNVVPLKRRRNWTPALGAAAAIAACAAVALGIWAFSLSGSQDPVESVLSKPGSRLVSMGTAGAMAVAPDGTAVLQVSVPPAPSGKTYEAWVIRDGKAKAAGLFPGRAGTSVVEIPRPVRPGAVVAVTLERAGGVQQPTSKPLAQSEEVKS
jgi:anti-sigma-K factor RskA